MTIEAKVIADSVNEQGNRITTFQLRYPRFIHAEFMTHRAFSRNASSSRAIPVAKMIEDLRRDPAMPVFWGSNKPGMQAGDQIDHNDLAYCKAAYMGNMEASIQCAEFLIKHNLHKQIANRILEPWAHINVVCTATEYDNFYLLRMHKDAQPEIQELATKMWDAQKASTPVLLVNGQWHMPYVDWNQETVDQANKDITANGVLRWVPTDAQIAKYLLKISVARCARVSYLTHDGRPTTFREDSELYEKLVGSEPLHASPTEHQATPDVWHGQPHELFWEQPETHGNFKGWIQYRRTLDGGIV